jgi:two-component system, NtrC family, nitrogen regulation sensor histidine kinase NtrY
MSRGLRLKTRVTWFFVLAALPAVLVSALSIKIIDNIIALELQRRRANIERLVRLSLEGEQARLESALQLISNDDGLQSLKNKLDDDAALEEVEDLAARLAARVELSAFAILAQTGPMKGSIISSAHLPQAIGDPPSAELNIDSIESATTGIGLDYVADNPPTLVPLLIATRTMARDDGSRALILYGGTRLDGPFLRRIAQMTGSALELHIHKHDTLKFVPTDRTSTYSFDHAIPLNGLGQDNRRTSPSLKIGIAPSPLAKFRKQLLVMSLVAGILILLGASLGGIWLSRPITTPILELAGAAKKVGDGNLDVRVDKRRSDEVGELVDVFNQMVEEIVRGQSELARAERVAAWRDAARQVAHEIKNPLTPMRMSMETLRKAHKLKHESFDEILHESTQAVLEEVQALARIVSAFSEFARLPSPQIASVHPFDLLNSSARLYGTMPPKLKINLDSEAITSRALEPIAADRDQIGRVLINLIKNAAEAIGGQTGEITLDAKAETRRSRGGVAISVQDDGPGMSPQVQDDVMKPYFTTKAEGTGLGLAIVERVVHEHQGELSFQTQSDQGTVVTVWLPYFSNSNG